MSALAQTPWPSAGDVYVGTLAAGMVTGLHAAAPSADASLGVDPPSPGEELAGDDDDEQAPRRTAHETAADSETMRFIVDLLPK
jgi:hypothetical protein